jgi:hypothetical protein
MRSIIVNSFLSWMPRYIQKIALLKREIIGNNVGNNFIIFFLFFFSIIYLRYPKIGFNFRIASKKITEKFRLKYFFQ